MHNICPTVTALFRRNVIASSLCLFCGECEETVEHLFFECHTSNFIWHCSPLGFNFEVGARLPFVKWLENWFSSALNNSTITMSIIFLWHIWLVRNKFIWEDIPVNPPQVCNQSLSVFHEVMSPLQDCKVNQMHEFNHSEIQRKESTEKEVILASLPSAPHSTGCINFNGWFI